MYYYLALTKTFDEATNEKYKAIFDDLIKTNSSFAEAVEESKKYDNNLYNNNNFKHTKKETEKKEEPIKQSDTKKHDLTKEETIKQETKQPETKKPELTHEEAKQKLKEELLNEEEKPGRFDYVCENPGTGFKILQFMASTKFTVVIFICSILVSAYMLYTQKSLSDMKNNFKV